MNFSVGLLWPSLMAKVYKFLLGSPLFGAAGFLSLDGSGSEYLAQEPNRMGHSPIIPGRIIKIDQWASTDKC